MVNVPGVERSESIDRVVSHDWSRSDSVVAFPRGWQRPARTEEWAYEMCRSTLGPASFAELVCFPWATLLDLLSRDRRQRAQPYLDALAHAPARSTLLRATVCQHIHADRLLPHLEALGITDLFWSHACTGSDRIGAIRIHPFPLYPVRCLDRIEPDDGGAAHVEARDCLYSFVGAYSPEGYLTPVRQWIFDLPPRPDALVQRRADWHYEAQVYGEQIASRTITDDERRTAAARGAEYDRTLRRSIFSLCPSGSGPNSIRLWESLGFGCIPVVLADTLRLPGPPSLWRDAIVRVPETSAAIAALPDRLEALAQDAERLDAMRRAGREAWMLFGERGPSTVLGVLRDTAWIRRTLGLHSVPIGLESVST